MGASRFRIIQTRSPAVPAQVGGPPWAAASTRAKGMLPSPPQSGPRPLPRTKVKSPNYPGFLSCLTGFPELHRSQGRSHAGVKGHEEDSAPVNARESLGTRGAWPASGLSLGPREGETTPLVAPPTLDHVIAASLGQSFQHLPLVHVTPLRQVGGEAGSPSLLRRPGLTLTFGSSRSPVCTEAVLPW